MICDRPDLTLQAVLADQFRRVRHALTFITSWLPVTRPQSDKVQPSDTRLTERALYKKAISPVDIRDACFKFQDGRLYCSCCLEARSKTSGAGIS